MPNLRHIGFYTILNLRHCRYNCRHCCRIGGRNLLIGGEMCRVCYTADIVVSVVFDGWGVAIYHLSQSVATMLLGVGVQQHKHRSIAPFDTLELTERRITALCLFAFVAERAKANVAGVVIS